jgi:hypothetical protein
MKLAQLGLVACCGILLSLPTASSPADDPVTSLSAAMALIFQQDRPFPAIEMLREGVETGKIPARLAAQFYSISGDTLGTERMHDRDAVPSVWPSATVDLDNATARPALAEIVKEADRARVVMLNEDHTHQRHRAFALLLLIELRKIGFTHFAAETFGPRLQASMVDGAPDLETGIYTADPLYADMARQATILGYSMFDYEQRPHQENAGQKDSRLARETAQAENIGALLRGNPTARIFIYAGASHISESDNSDDRLWMAQILKRSSALDPLTINQIWGTPRSRSELDSPLYNSVVDRFAQTTPFVIRRPAGLLSAPGFDVAVFHPRARYFEGRPDWLSMGGYRQPCRIAITPSPQAHMIRAFKASEPPLSIAMDQVLVPTQVDQVTLMLPPGEYRLVQQGGDREQTLGYVTLAKLEPPTDAPPISAGPSHTRCQPKR